MSFHYVVAFLTLLVACNAWNSVEMEMFDLVEEVKISFYEYLNIDPTASSPEIKRSYRKLSAELHPDKNPDDPEATKKFRQLVAIYEILKNEESREKYDDILKNGLPDWRMPVFYYRKLRRMSNMELLFIFTVLSTVIHYAVLWGSRYEKLWTLEDQLSAAYKRHKARDKKREAIDIQIAEQLCEIPRPQWHDILPFAIIKGFYSFFLFLPALFVYLKIQLLLQFEQYKTQLQANRESSENLQTKYKIKVEKQERKRRLLDQKSSEPSAYDSDILGTFFSLSDIPSERSDNGDFNKRQDVCANTEWSESDVVNLVRAVARFPGGVPDRWIRIAETVGRTVPEVALKAKHLGEKCMNKVYIQDQMSSEIPVFETNMNAVCGESSEEEFESEKEDTGANEQQSPSHVDESVEPGTEKSMTSCVMEPPKNSDETTPDISQLGGTIDEPYLSRKKLKQQKLNARKEGALERRVSVEPSDGWTQVEQKQLEVAIRSIDKSTSERWDRIAECVPTKTKAEVMIRVRHLSNVAKSRTSRT